MSTPKTQPARAGAGPTCAPGSAATPTKIEGSAAARRCKDALKEFGTSCGTRRGEAMCGYIGAVRPSHGRHPTTAPERRVHGWLGG